MSLQENSEIEEMNSTDKDINIDDSQKKAKGRNSKRAKKGGKKGGKKQKKCSLCGEPATRHDLCNRCRQKVESRTKRQVAQKFEKSGQCGSAFSAFLRRCVNFGLEPAKLTFFTTLSLMNQVFPIWHLRHESDQYFEDERGCKHSRWNMPDSHIEKVFGNLYKELRENPILDGTEYSGDQRFNRNEINRILEQKLEQTLKEFGKLHQFSFSGNAYCCNENDNNSNNSNNTNEKHETRQRMKNEDNNNMESNPQAIHSRSNDRSNSNNNNNNNNNNVMNNGLLCEGRRSFFRPTVSTQYISNNNMSSNVNGSIMNNAGITEGVNPFSFGLDMAPYVPRISYIQSNENNLMERENGPNECGLSYSAPTSPIMRVQPSRMGRMVRMTTALPCIPQESPISSFEQSFSNLGNFAQNMRLANSNQSYENENWNNNNNSSNNSNYFGSITPAMIPQCIAQNDGNGFENVYSSSNDESYDSSDGSQASQGMVSRNSSVNVNISNSNNNSNHFNYNYNGSIGNVDSAWDTSSLISFGGNSTVAHFNDMASLNSFHLNDNASVISIASPFGYNGARGSRLSSPVVPSNDMNNDNNNHNIIWGSPLPPF